MDETSSTSSKRLSVNSNRTTEGDSLFKAGVRQDLLLHEAAIKNDINATMKLIHMNADLNSKSHMQRVPIHWAIIHNNMDIVSLLIEAKCDIEAVDKFGMRPILMAAMVGNLDIVKMLINSGCNCQVVNKKQYTVLHCAIKHDQTEIVTYLLNNVPNLDINAVNDSCQTGLMMACINNNQEIVDKLIAAGADVNIKDKQGRLASHWASFKGHDKVLLSLLKAGINADEKDGDGKTALHLSAEYGYKLTSKCLIEQNCDIHSVDGSGRTALMIAAALGYLEVVQMLIQHNVNLNSKDKNGNTALHLCVMGNHVRMASFLIDNHADINCVNIRQQTPLVVAAELGHVDVAKILINHSADLFATEKSGRTALYIASRGSFQALVDMIIKAEREQFLKTRNCETINDQNTDVDVQTQSDFADDFEAGKDVGQDSFNFSHTRKLLYYLSRHHLHTNDWKRLARFWDFTEDQIKAIEHQYTGKASYKDHAYRMLVIWLHGLSPTKSALDELYDALIYINKSEVAEKLKRKAQEQAQNSSNKLHCRCFPAIPSNVCHYCCIV